MFKSPLLLSLCLGLLSLPALRAETVTAPGFPDGSGAREFSPVPPPGVHPRIFISPEDLPALRRDATNSPARKVHYQALRKAVAERLDNPTTPEGAVMALLAKGETPSDARFASTTELGYLLALAAIDAQVRNDQVRGEFLGRALSAWGTYELTNWVRRPDPAGLHNSFDSGICLAYDFLAPWMTDAQRVPVRKFIVKMSDGIHIFTWDWPAHMRMWNWAGLHVYQGWSSLAIEGEEGWKPQLWNEAKTVVRDFCRYNIHPSGALTEDITYFSFAIRGAGPGLIAMARRGEADVLAGGSNFGKLKYHLINQLEPWGGANFMSHQDGGGAGFYGMWIILKYLYPQDPIVDVVYRNRVGDDYNCNVAGNDGDMRTWAAVLFNTEYLTNKLAPADLKLPVTYFCPDRSYLIARTGWDTNALKLDFEAKTDYPTVGHNHADANNFTFAALGREWATEVGYHGASGHLHNNVLIDGRSESGWPTPGGRWLDLVDAPQATFGVGDARHAYSYHWSNSGYGSENRAPSELEKWERETLPDVVEFSREQDGGKGRMTIFEHYGPILRSEWNPVEKAFRTAALIRGKRPYALIVDDIRKDDATHLYEWAMQMPEDVEIIKGGGRWVILGAKESPAVKGKDGKEEKPKPDLRRLLVQIVDVDVPSDKDALSITLETTQLSNDAFENGKLRKRLVIPARSVEPHFKIMLYPHQEGEALPDVLWNDEHNACDIAFPDQTDHLAFAPAAEGRTAVSLSRDGQVIATLKAAPAAPIMVTRARAFTDRLQVELSLPGADQELRYTTDGSEPGANSTFYAGPIELTDTATLKVATFARRWAFGDQKRSEVVEAHFTKQTLRDPAAAPANAAPGLQATIYAGFWNTLPDFASLKPLLTTTVPQVQIPAEAPAKGFGVVLNGFIRIPAAGVYTFGLNCDDAGRIWIDGQPVVDNDGQHIVRTRTGEIALKAGLHALRIANCDGAIALGTGKGDGSWAFKALWATAGAELTEIPASILLNGGGSTGSQIAPAIAAVTGLRTETGLEYAAYDRTAQAGTLALFDLAGATPLSQSVRERIETPDSSPNLLHVYRGYLTVSHPGIYSFRFDATGIGEVRIGDTVVSRSGIPGQDLSQPVQLAEGLAPFEVRLAHGNGQIRWQGPGMSWQTISPLDLSRPLRPLATLAGRDLDCASYELFGPTPVTLRTVIPAEGLQLVYSLDGSDPTAGGTVYTQPFTQSATATLRTRLMDGKTPVGTEATIRLTASTAPTTGLIGCWSSTHVEGSTLRNEVLNQAADLRLPDGTRQVEDPVQGKVLEFEHSSKVMLDKTAILANELTMAFRVKTSSEGMLVRYGYAHFGIFLGVSKNGDLSPGGGGAWHAGESKGGLLNDGKWHEVVATFGGQPIRQIETWIDGVKRGSGRSKAPCVTKELEFLQGFTGQLAEIRMYNRLLSPSEISTLTCGLAAAP